MSDLVAFLRARLDEDEAEAKAASDSPWTIAKSRRAEDDEMAILSGDVEIVGAGYEGGGVWMKQDAGHIARHDPARVLREVAAKRAILDEVVPQIDDMDARIESEWGTGGNIPTGESDRLLSLLVLPYADHPDCREEWKPLDSEGAGLPRP